MVSMSANRKVTVGRDVKGANSAYRKWWELASYLYTPCVAAGTSFLLWTLVDVGQVFPSMALGQRCYDAYFQS